MLLQKPTFKAYYNGAVAHLALPDELAISLDRFLSYKDGNVAYALKQNPRAKTKEPVKHFYKKSLMPTGLLPRAASWLKRQGYGIDCVCTIEKPLIVTPTYPDWLRGYQLDAISIGLEEPRSLLQMPTRSGKTVVAACIAANFPEANILFTVPWCYLAHQTVESFKDIGLFKEEEIGLVGDNENNWQRITVAVIDSVAIEAKNPDSKLKHIQVVIHDEVHKSNDKYLTATSALVNQYYSIGLTATDWRADGGNIQLEAVCGPTNYSLSEQEIVDAGGKLLPTYIFVKAPSRDKVLGKVEKVLNTDNTNEMRKAYYYRISENPYRNKLISDLSKSLLESPNRNGAILVLVKYVKHAQALYDLIYSSLDEKYKDSIAVCTYQTKKKAKKDYIERLNNGTLDLLIGSSVLGTGVDIPMLEYQINADAGSNKGNLIQHVGRVQTNCKAFEKNHAYLIDIADTDNYYGRRVRVRESHIKDRFPNAKIYHVDNLVDLENQLDRIRNVNG